MMDTQDYQEYVRLTNALYDTIMQMTALAHDTQISVALYHARYLISEAFKRASFLQDTERVMRESKENQD